ncbi:MAG: hypothetical protein AAFU85_09955 [Planctomycetota bacterium]
MSRHLLLLVLLVPSLGVAAAADEAPANSELVVDEAFDNGGELAKPWSINTGKWIKQDGVLRAAEVESDNHSAAARRVIETSNAVYQLRFRFVEDGKVFHFGFDPARGELKKRGHLFSVVVSPNGWRILKHVDKDRPKEAPNEVLARGKTTFEKGTWHSLRVTTWGPYVTAKVDGKDTLKASDPTFGVKKPTLVFRCIGDGVEIDDVKVWKQIGS